IRTGNDEHVLLVTLHHIVCDGWSFAILMREFGEFYAAFHSGLPVTLSDLPIHYGDYAVWQREWLQGEILEKQVEYWRKQLTGLQVLELPVDRVRPAESSRHGNTIKFNFSVEVTRQLNSLSRQDGVT